MAGRTGCGCREFRELSRRRFIGGSAAAALAATAPAWLPRVAYAQFGGGGSSDRDVLVSVYLRGGADGLTLCVPHGEDAYYAARPKLAVPRPDSQAPSRAVDLNGFFGFPPAMAPLLEAYQAGHLLVVHAAGSTDPSRSHFDAQHFMEAGIPQDSRVTTGWLGRHLAGVPPLKAGALLRGIGVDAGLVRTLYGAPQTLPIPDPASFSLTGARSTKAARSAWLGRVYGATGDPILSAAKNTLNTISLLEKINFAQYQPAGGAAYPATRFGTALRSSATLIKADVGVEAIHVDLSSWDTHSGQGPLDGRMAALMTDLAGGLTALHRDLFAGAAPRVTVVVVTEFGRNVGENASDGTDHGHGTVILLLGARIAGGRVLTRWPGLQAGQLDRGQDLQVTIDYRDILGEVVQRRLGNSNLAAVFPGYTPTFQGVTI